MIYQILFFVFAALAVLSALGVVMRKNPVHAGVSLLMTFVSFAALYILLNAQFIAVIQITIYAGAILVLVLFVIMLLNLREPGRGFIDLAFSTRQGVAALVFIGLFIIELATLLFLRTFDPANATGKYSTAKISSTGSIQSLSEVLFTKYLFPFEVASVLLLVAIIGAVVLTRHEKKVATETEEGGKS
jgi:NADH-quinone oxidoreductase subunit J